MRPAAVLLALALPSALAAQGHGALSVRTAEGWAAWWSPRNAPVHWTAPDSSLVGALAWRDEGDGLGRAELTIAAPGEGVRTRVVLVRFDPSRLRLALIEEGGDGGARWTVDRAPTAARLAVNMGQFTAAGAWGWLVVDGQERQAPGTGPLSTAFVVRDDGTAALIPAAAIDSVRRAGGVWLAVQSYPTLLDGDGAVPAPLRADGQGIDRAHRDARLALCALRDGRFLLVLTRFGGLGPIGGSIPLGLTTPEMAALTGALGCRQAVALDGGISAQLALHPVDGATRVWRGWRRVPVGLVGFAR